MNISRIVSYILNVVRTGEQPGRGLFPVPLETNAIVDL